MERLSKAQEDLLRSLMEEGEGGYLERGETPALVELGKRGYLTCYSSLLNGDCRFRVSEKTAAYFEALEREEQQQKEAKRHDWALNFVNGVYAIAAAIVGGVIGYLIGIAAN